MMSACAGETSTDTVACGEGTALTSDGLTCAVDSAYVESATEVAVTEALANVESVECGDGTTLADGVCKADAIPPGLVCGDGTVVNEGQDACIISAEALTAATEAAVEEALANVMPVTCGEGTVLSANGSECGIDAEDYVELSGEFVLDGDYADVAGGMEMEVFKGEVVAQLASDLGIDASEITINDVADGSIKIKYTLIKEKKKEAAAALKQKLLSKTKLKGYDVIEKTVDETPVSYLLKKCKPGTKMDKATKSCKPNKGDGTKVDPVDKKVKPDLGDGTKVDPVDKKVKPDLGDGTKVDPVDKKVKPDLGDGAKVDPVDKKVKPDLGDGTKVDPADKKVKPDLGDGTKVDPADKKVKPDLGDGTKVDPVDKKVKPDLGDGAKVDPADKKVKPDLGPGAKVDPADKKVKPDLGPGTIIDSIDQKVKPNLGDDDCAVDGSDGLVKPVLDNICDTKKGAIKFAKKCGANADDGTKIDPVDGKVKPDLGDGTKVDPADKKVKPDLGPGAKVDPADKKVKPDLGDGTKVDPADKKVKPDLGDGTKVDPTDKKVKPDLGPGTIVDSKDKKVKPDLSGDEVAVDENGKVKPVLENICDKVKGSKAYYGKCIANLGDGTKLDSVEGKVKPDLGPGSKVDPIDKKVKPNLSGDGVAVDVNDGKVKPVLDNICDKTKGSKAFYSKCIANLGDDTEIDPVDDKVKPILENICDTKKGAIVFAKKCGANLGLDTVVDDKDGKVKPVLANICDTKKGAIVFADKCGADLGDGTKLDAAGKVKPDLAPGTIVDAIDKKVKPDISGDGVAVVDGKVKPVLDNICDKTKGSKAFYSKCIANLGTDTEVDPVDDKVKPILTNICDTAKGLKVYADKCEADLDNICDPTLAMTKDGMKCKPVLDADVEIDPNTGTIKPKPGTGPVAQCEKLKGCDCSTEPCENDGMCSVSDDDFLCACPKGFAGESCSIALEDVDKTKVLPPFVIDKYAPKCLAMGCEDLDMWAPEWKVKASQTCLDTPTKCQVDMGVTGSLITGVEAPAGHLIKQKAGTSAYYEMKLTHDNWSPNLPCKNATLVNAEVEGATGLTEVKYTSVCIESGGMIHIIIAVYAHVDVVYKGIKVQIAMVNGANFSAPGTAKVSPKADKSSVYDGVDLIKGEFIIFKK